MKGQLIQVVIIVLLERVFLPGIVVPFSCSSFDLPPLCLQGLTVAVAICFVASTGTLTSTTVPMITRLRLPPRSAKRTLWWWLTRSREYRFDKTAVAAMLTNTFCGGLEYECERFEMSTGNSD